MISKEFIESFEKVLEYYKIEKEDVFDIVRAISFSESEGTHPIRLRDLASSGVDYFSDIVSDKTNSKPLPDARLARVMVDSLSVILYVTNNSLFSSPDMISVLTASSDSVHKVCQKVVNYYNPSRANHLKFDKTSNYRTLEESERDMKRLLSTCINSSDFEDLVSFKESIDFYLSNLTCSTRLKELIKDFTKKYTIPIDLDYIGTNGALPNNIKDNLDTYSRAIKTTCTLAFMFTFLDVLSNKLADNSVKTNMRLTKLASVQKELIGVDSRIAGVASFDFYHFKGSAPHIITKLEKLFSKSKALDYNDIFKIATYIYYIDINDINISYNDCLIKFREV